MTLRTGSLIFALVLATVLTGAAPADAEQLTVRGRVVDEDDRPLADARVTLRPLLDLYREGQRVLAGQDEPKPVARGRSNRLGEFELAAPEIGLWRITVEAEGRVAMTRILRPLLYDQTLDDVRLLSAETFKVHVTDGDSPVAGALVEAVTVSRDFEPWRQAWRTGRWWPVRRWAITDGGGGVTLRRAVAEQPEIRAMKSGFRPGREGPGSDAGLTAIVTLEPSLLRTVEVVDLRGEPVSGVLFLDVWWPLGITGDGGSVELTSAYLEREPPSLTLDTGDGYQATLTSFAADQTVLRLLPPFEVSGRVIDGATGRPIAGALVWRDRGPAGALRTDTRGRFRCRTPEKELRLGFAAEGYRALRQTVEAEAETTSDLAVALEAAAGIAGRVVDEDGLPVAGAEVQVRPAGSGYRSWNARRTSYRPTTTSADGDFRFDGLPMGEVQEIRAYRDGYAPAAATLTAAAPGDEPEAEIVLRRGTVLVGQVVDVDGHAIAGAQVRVFHQPPTGEARLEIPEGEYLSAPEAATDDDGRFEVQSLPAGEHLLTVHRPGYATRTLPRVRVEASTSQLDLGTIPLAAAAALEVKVADRDGEPIAGVQVQMSPQTHAWPNPPYTRDTRRQTGTDGLVRYDDLETGERVDLRLDHPSYIEEHLQAVGAPTREPLEIVLRRGAAVSGIVVTQDGQGVARASLRAESTVENATPWGSPSQHFHKSDWSDADGRFELRGLHPGDVRLSAGFQGLAEAVVQLRLAEGEERRDVRIELGRGAAVSGRVLDPHGRPVIGVEVSLVHHPDERERRRAVATTDGAGRFRITGRPLGRAEVSARHPQLGAASVELDMVPGENPVELTLAPARLVSGRVVDASGQPVPEARVDLSRRSGSSISTGTAADGSFLLVPEASGDYELSAEREDLPRVTRPLSVGDEPVSGIELVLREGAAIVGAVLGVPPEERGRVMIWAHPVEGRGRGHQGAVDVHGDYRISGLDPGMWHLRAHLPGSGRAAQATVEVLAGEPEVVRDLELVGGDLRLTGVVLTGGAPARAELSIHGASGASTSTTTDHEGRFRLEDLEPGSYRLWIHGDWGAHEETVELWSDRDLRLSFELRRVTGRTVSGDGAPLAEVRLTLQATEGTSRVNALSDAEGRFVFPWVREARYRLLASRQGFTATSSILDVQGVDLEGLEVALSRGAPLVFELRTPSGEMPRNVHVAARGGDGGTVASEIGEPDPAGRLEITAIPPGSWQVALQASDSVPVRLEVEVPGGPYVVGLEPRTVLTVTVPALAGSSEPATLILLDAAGRPFTPSRIGIPREDWPILQGESVLPYLPSGTWGLRVETAGGASWSGVATTQVGRPAEVVLR